MTPVLDHIDLLTRTYRPGPSPLYVCSRPSCRIVYRYLSSTPAAPECPRCYQPYVPAKRGPRLTTAQREAMA